MDWKFGDYRHSKSSRLWVNFNKCGPNRLLKKWVNFAGGIRLDSKIPASPLSLLFFDVSRQKIKFIVRGPCNCTPFAQQRISWNCGWLRSTIPRLKHLKKLLELTVCSCSPSFVVVNQTIPEIFGEFPLFSPHPPMRFLKIWFQEIQDLDKVVDRFIHNNLSSLPLYTVGSVTQSCPRVTFLGPDPTYPTRRNVDPTQPDPQLLTKILTRPDPRPYINL